MNFKRYVESSDTWIDTPHYIHNTSTDTITTLPAVLYPNDTTATVGLKGDMQQSSQPSPTNPIQPSECGDKTANLFNKNGEVLTGNGSVINIIATGIKAIVQSQGSNRYSTLKLDNELLGKTITITANITQSASNKGQIRLFYVNGRYATSFITSITTEGQTGYITKNYTMPSSIPSGSDGIAIVLSADRDGDGDVGDYVEYADLMIVSGSTAPTTYIPYGYKIPISSANTTTPVYLGEVETTRKIKKLVLDGTESWQESGTASGRIVGDLRIPKPYGRQVITPAECVMCSHIVSMYPYPSDVLNRVVVNQYMDGTIFISFTDEIIGGHSFANFVTYLQQQYANGTPVTVWYVLEKPTTGIVNEPIRKIGTYVDEVSGITIPTIAGANTLSVGTTLQPSEVTVNYKGWHPILAVHERENGQWD